MREEIYIRLPILNYEAEPYGARVLVMKRPCNSEHDPEKILHLEAEYIYADCPFAQLQTSCSPAADHTLTPIMNRVFVQCKQ